MMQIDVCICTFRRPHITETMASVAAAQVPPGARLRLVIIDNDDTPTAQERVTAMAANIDLPVQYLHAPGANISIARNAALDAAQDADWIAFLDDDEVVEPHWLTALVARQAETNADAVFGHARALYDETAPRWMVEGDFHSQYAHPRGDEIETGHTCNVLMRLRDMPWAEERFDLARGRSGGEDTEFFFRLRNLGARYAIAEDSFALEAVPPGRATLSWLVNRRFRIGQSYAAVAQSGMARVTLFVSAAMKSAYCALRAVLALFNPGGRAFWMLRGTMHAGVCAGCLRLRQATLYGESGS